MTIRERENLLNKMVKENSIGESDKEIYRFAIGLFIKGPDYFKILKWTKIKNKESKIWFNRLIKSGYIKDNKICLEKEFFDDGISFHLMIGCMLGYLKRKE